MKRRHVSAFGSTCVLLVLAACGPTGTPIEKTSFASALQVDLAQSTKLPNGLYLRDVSVGTGAEAKLGALVTMRYTGWLPDGTQFDSNQTSGFQFRIGAGQVIRGWDEGTSGMKVGGERQLIIPPELGYGDTATGPIPAHSILVFNVTMMSTP